MDTSTGPAQNGTSPPFSFPQFNSTSPEVIGNSCTVAIVIVVAVYRQGCHDNTELGSFYQLLGHREVCPHNHVIS